MTTSPTTTSVKGGVGTRKRRMTENLEMMIDRYLVEKEQEVDIPFWIQDPLVVDIDRITKTGVVATGKHRKNTIANRSEHKILFWEYPSWKLIRSFELNLTPPNLTCQIIGIQSIIMPTVDGKGTQKVRFFSLAVGMALVHEFEPDIEDRVDIWKSLFIYRLFNDGSTQCVSHIKVSDLFLGREIFLFSDTSWAKSSDGDYTHAAINHPTEKPLQDWMKIVSPVDAIYDKRFTVFLMAIGPIYERITGCVQLARFDMRGQHNILDPSITPVHWDHASQQISPLPRNNGNNFLFGYPTEVITTIKLGSDVSCMIHFKHPPSLNHLICTGSYQDDELSVYDWRFGIKVGSLPWNSPLLSQHHQQQEREEDDNETVETLIDVRPWGLESTLVLPPYWGTKDTENKDDVIDLSQRGFRLIAVGDNRSDNSRDKLEIKVWDISYLLKVKWDPLVGGATNINETIPDLSHRFGWWSRRTAELERLAHAMVQQQELELQQLENRRIVMTTTSLLNENALLPNNFTTTTIAPSTLSSITSLSSRSIHTSIPINLPYSPSPKQCQSMLLSHTFDKDEREEENGELTAIPVKYTAYNVLYTSLFLLTEDGKVTVMDIETGKITGTVQNVAANADLSTLNVRGIDVNVIGGKEVVVTSKEGLLRGIVN